MATSKESQQARPCAVHAQDGVLTIVVCRDFDVGSLHQDWAHAIAVEHPGPFREVRIDLSGVGAISSTFFAGIVQLHHFYRGKGAEPLRLVRPDPRVLRNLALLRLDKIFVIEPR